MSKREFARLAKHAAVSGTADVVDAFRTERERAADTAKKRRAKKAKGAVTETIAERVEDMSLSQIVDVVAILGLDRQLTSADHAHIKVIVEQPHVNDQGPVGPNAPDATRVGWADGAVVVPVQDAPQAIETDTTAELAAIAVQTPRPAPSDVAQLGARVVRYLRIHHKHPYGSRGVAGIVEMARSAWRAALAVEAVAAQPRGHQGHVQPR